MRYMALLCGLCILLPMRTIWGAARNEQAGGRAADYGVNHTYACATGDYVYHGIYQEDHRRWFGDTVNNCQLRVICVIERRDLHSHVTQVSDYGDRGVAFSVHSESDAYVGQYYSTPSVITPTVWQWVAGHHTVDQVSPLPASDTCIVIVPTL